MNASTHIYTCLDLRRDKLADPTRLPAAAEAHLTHCEQCRAFARRIDTLEQRAAQVLAVPVPDGLSERVLLRVHRNVKRPWKLWALAACFIMSFGIGTRQWQPREETDYARLAINHVMHEPEALSEHRLADPARFRTVLANFGGELSAPLGTIRYMRLCPVPHGTGWHIVIDTEAGPATLLLIPGMQLSGAVLDAKFGGLTARALPGGQGYYAIVAETPRIVDAVEKLISQRVRWRT